VQLHQAPAVTIEQFTQWSNMPSSLFSGVELDAFVKRGSQVQSRGAAQGGETPLSSRNHEQPGTLQKIEEVLPAIRGVVAELAWRNRWLDTDELKQEAMLTALAVDARGLWRSSPAPVPYMARAVRSRLVEMVMRSGCPVKVGIGSHTGGWSTACGMMVGARAVDVDDRIPCDCPDPEGVIDRSRALAEMRKVLAEQTPAARAVILDEEKPADVAQGMGLTERQVYKQTERARAAVKARLLAMVGR
jgi:DNA-directed RNA polymerase specialized sigma24 family protein